MMTILGLSFTMILVVILLVIQKQRKFWNNGICAASGRPWTQQYIDARDENSFSDGAGNQADFGFNCVTNTWPNIFTKVIF